MGIAPVTSDLNNAFSPFHRGSAIKLLENRKQQLQEQIQKIDESKMDDKRKQEKIKSLQDQIQQLDIEIQERRSEKQRLRLNTNQSAVGIRSNTGVGGNDGYTSGMTQLIQASAVYSQVKILERAKNSLGRKISGLRTEIKLDEERGFDTKAKRKELYEAERREKMLNIKAGDTLQAIENRILEASAEEADDTQINSKNEDKNNRDAISAGKTDDINNWWKKAERIDRNYRKIDIRA